MTPLRRTAALATACALTLLLVSCGVDAGDAASPGGSSSATTAPDTTPSEPDPELTPAEQEAVDRVKDLYVDLGMDPEDAECLAEGIAGNMESFDPSDTGAMMDIINECDISMSELSELGQDQGLDSMEDGLKFGLEESLKQEGLSDEQAGCVADAFVEEFGTDVSAAEDPSALQPLFEGCDVDPSMIPGG